MRRGSHSKYLMDFLLLLPIILDIFAASRGFCYLRLSQRGLSVICRLARKRFDPAFGVAIGMTVFLILSGVIFFHARAAAIHIGKCHRGTAELKQLYNKYIHNTQLLYYFFSFLTI